MGVVSVEAPDTGRLDVPEAGQLVRVRGQQWVVTGVRRSKQPADELAATRLPGRTLVSLTSVSDDDLGEELTVVWEVEPGREVVPATKLPEVSATAWDDPQKLGAFLDAVRWGTVTSADTRTLQAPFRSGISLEEYQLEPVARALGMPRVTCSSPTTWAWARRSRLAWSFRRCCSGTARGACSWSAPRR